MTLYKGFINLGKTTNISPRLDKNSCSANGGIKKPCSTQIILNQIWKLIRLHFYSTQNLVLVRGGLKSANNWKTIHFDRSTWEKLLKFSYLFSFSQVMWQYTKAAIHLLTWELTNFLLLVFWKYCYSIKNKNCFWN